MRSRSLLYSLFLFCASAVHALSWTATPFSPPSYPLAVRTPYLSAWLNQGAGTALNGAWPAFWTGTTLGWAGFVKVDSTVYSFLGASSVPGATFSQATQKSATFTSTQSTFVLEAGGINLTVTFLSPVEPTNVLLQSIPFAYMAVSAVSNDGASHTVAIYSDISAEWITGDNTLEANWTTTTTSNIITHQVQLVDQTVYGEVSDHTQYGAAYYSFTDSTGTTYQTGQDVVVRAQFINNGVLANTKDTNFRAVENDWPVFGFSRTLGSVGTTATSPAVFTIGHVRDPAIEYILANDVYQPRSVYFWSTYSTVAALITEFMGDYSNALSRANTLDSKVESDASAISSDYAAIVALSIRQAMGALELTISKESSGAWNTSDILMFLKEISSDGNVNTVDVIFPAWPALLYLNPTLGKYLLLGLFEYQATGQYPNKWSAHDLGSSYPKAIGHNDGSDEAMPVEECGNMLIMALSYTQKSGDDSLIKSYASTALLDQWTQYLISDSLIPNNQLSTDDFAGTLANQTNLAIKGIVGIKAMSEIYTLLGDTSKASNYSSIASSYVSQWQTFATSTTGAHLTLSYGNSSSWGLSYNLYGDKLLGLNLFPSSVYAEQTAWYQTVTEPYGVPLDTRHTYTKSDWSIWTASIMTTTTARNDFVNFVYKYASAGVNNAPLGDWYETLNGDAEGFRARPVVGGHLALLLV